MTPQEIEKLEIELLLEAILRRHGYDFRHYAHASLKRRMKHLMANHGLTHISEILPRALHDEAFFDAFLKDMSIVVTEMFRDPKVFLTLRQKVVPLLKTYPIFKVWHAGCATGEEVYTLAILLTEEDLYDRAQIYATDYNVHSLEIAGKGIYPVDKIKQYTENHHKAGGKVPFSDYYYAQYGSAKMQESLKAKIIFSHHNLVSDSVFGEMNLIMCRNVLIYFDRELQNRVLNLFYQSLEPLGILCLGTKETLAFSDVADKFEIVAKDEKIYRKIA